VGHWANQGLMYYVVPRLRWNATADVEKMIADYCQLDFGPAAPKMAEYFAKIESFTRLAGQRVGRYVEEEMRSDEQENIQSGDQFLKFAPEIYTSERLREAIRLLDEATPLADAADVKARIRFLREGLRYAEVQNRVYAIRNAGNTNPADVRPAFDEKYDQFRQWFQDDFYAVGVSYLTYSEGWMESSRTGWKFSAALPPVPRKK